MRVVSLWRFPVKSMQGEELATATIDELGIEGDRQWALVHLGTGLALTARRVPELLFASACLVGDDVEITLPDGTAAPDDAALSAWLGRDIELRRAGGEVRGRFEIAADFEDEAGMPWFEWDGPDGTFHDSGKTRVSFIGTGTIGSGDRRRFRGNVLIETDGVDVEQGFIGHRIEVGCGRRRRRQGDPPLCHDDPTAARRHRARPRCAAHDQRRARHPPRRRHADRAAGRRRRRRRAARARPGRVGP